eukprot:Gregarina_sp_Poly_1__7183@NODE_393_length_8957_cov_1164_871316_g322_i0_p2_GENE_NODE_393_length_8957_cov_1164_871316_g322_i0NODE_393_length_8957_cov_1164_871316_g322_i0_p2_ORF_typecomplete_len555_score76_84Integrin_beta/PF00362_18/1_6e16Integrin_beta/PF00362_18/2e06VWA/PF00092_28/0_032VWA/PF00092_28/3_3e03_NODE_393_length_8957_cov_1164_871316_g322_i035485212
MMRERGLCAMPCLVVIDLLVAKNPIALPTWLSNFFVDLFVNMKGAFFALSCVVLEASAKARAQDCNYALELLALQDGSTSFQSIIDKWIQTAQSLNQALLDEFGTYKLALSSFTDKPMPFRGYGKYGGWGSVVSDYCYKSHVPLGTDTNELVSALKYLSSHMGAGGDLPEGQFEAMLFAAMDKSVGWSDPSVTHSEDGRPIVRIILLITDARSHEPGQAAAAIVEWNVPRSYPNGYDKPSVGGFGSHQFADSYGVNNMFGNKEIYLELADLYAKKDAFEAGQGAALTAEQKTRMDELIVMFGPEVYPDIEYKEHPGDTSVMDCTKTEYPSFDHSVAAMKANNIFPIFLLANQDSYAFYEWYAATMGLNYAIGTFDSENLHQTIVDAIGSIVDKICLAPTSTTTGALTGSSAAHTSTPAASQPEGQSTGEGSKTDGVVGQSTAPGDKPISEPVESVTREGDTTVIDSTVETTTESGAAAVVVPPPAGGTPIGTIAGAAAGGVAGAAAIAGVLWKTAGFGMFGSPEGAASGVEQVEVPENQVEREAMEEVTMDMFN